MSTTLVPVTILPFGKHQGQLLTRVEPQYLQWMANKSPAVERDGVNWSELAQMELDRRGTNYDGIMPSHHAIDRFSQRHLDKWDQTQGIASALSAMATEAWAKGEVVEQEVYAGDEGEVVKKRYALITYVFVCNNGKAVGVKTVL